MEKAYPQWPTNIPMTRLEESLQRNMLQCMTGKMITWEFVPMNSYRNFSDRSTRESVPMNTRLLMVRVTQREKSCHLLSDYLMHHHWPISHITKNSIIPISWHTSNTLHVAHQLPSLYEHISSSATMNTLQWKCQEENMAQAEELDMQCKSKKWRLNRSMLKKANWLILQQDVFYWIVGKFHSNWLLL